MVCGHTESSCQAGPVSQNQVCQCKHHIQFSSCQRRHVAGGKPPTEIYTVDALLNDIENAELLKALITADKLTLQISLLKMNGYSTNEIAVLVHLSTDAIYKRIAVLKKKFQR